MDNYGVEWRRYYIMKLEEKAISVLVEDSLFEVY
jgi:hypothetical protein